MSMDMDIHRITCMEWIQQLQKYTLTLIELIDDLFCDAARLVDKLERKNQCYALQLSSRSDVQSRDYCSQSSRSKSVNYSDSESRLCVLHAEEQCYVDILNNEIQSLVEICDVQNKNMKMTEKQFSCQKEKIVKLVKSLMTRVTIGQQRLSNCMNAAICVNKLLSDNTQIYESDSSIFKDLRSKILEMRSENKCLKDRIEILRSTGNPCKKNLQQRCPVIASVSNPIPVKTTKCVSQQCCRISPEILKLECELKIKSERVERLRENNTHLERELRKSNIKCAKCENELGNECKKVTSLLEENLNLVRTLQNLKEGDAERANAIQNLSQKLYQKANAICTLQEQNSALCDKSKSVDYNKEKYETLLKSHAETKEKLRCLKEIKDLERTSHQQAICALEKMVNEKDIALETLKKRMEEFQSKSTESSCLKTKLCDAEKELNATKDQLKTFQDLLCNSQALNEEQMTETDNLNDEISQLKTKICAFESCNETLKSQVKQFRAHSPIRRENDSLQCEISSLKSTIFDLNKVNESWKLKAKSFEEIIKDLSTLNENQQQEICILKDKLQKQVTICNDTACKFDQLVEDYNEMQEDHKRILYELDCATETTKIYVDKDAASTKKIKHLESHLLNLTAGGGNKEQLMALNCELKRKNQVVSKENEKLAADNCDLERRNQVLRRRLEHCCCKS